MNGRLDLGSYYNYTIEVTYILLLVLFYISKRTFLYIYIYHLFTYLYIATYIYLCISAFQCSVVGFTFR